VTPFDGLIVLGPFRSGTSLTCQMLARLGVDFGPPEALWRADRFNPGGFLERLDVNHANGRLLESVGRTIVDPTAPAEVLERGDRRALASADLSWQRDGVGTGPWCLKDPRLCSTLATWLEAGRLEADGLGLVIVRRRPADVLASVLAYPTLAGLLEGDAGRARALVRACDEGAAWHADRLGRPVLELDYERMLDDPVATAAALAGFIGVADRSRVRAAAAEVGKRRALMRYYAGRIGRRLRRLAG
jgi:hypothetical protein